jgi:hypothetical protein
VIVNGEVMVGAVLPTAVFWSNRLRGGSSMS